MEQVDQPLNNPPLANVPGSVAGQVLAPANQSSLLGSLLGIDGVNACILNMSMTALGDDTHIVSFVQPGSVDLAKMLESLSAPGSLSQPQSLGSC